MKVLRGNGRRIAWGIWAAGTQYHTLSDLQTTDAAFSLARAFSPRPYPLQREESFARPFHNKSPDDLSKALAPKTSPWGWDSHTGILSARNPWGPAGGAGFQTAQLVYKTEARYRDRCGLQSQAVQMEAVCTGTLKLKFKIELGHM